MRGCQKTIGVVKTIVGQVKIWLAKTRVSWLKWELVGQNDNWLAPNDKFSYEYCDANETEKRNPDQDNTSNFSFEFRLRFKLPLASKLLEIDKAAFNYYYNQVKADYLNNIVCSADVRAANGK